MARCPLELANPFRENEHCLHYDPEGDDLLHVVRSALRDRECLRRMGLAARTHALVHHTDNAIAPRPPLRFPPAGKLAEVHEGKVSRE